MSKCVIAPLFLLMTTCGGTMPGPSGSQDMSATPGTPPPGQKMESQGGSRLKVRQIVHTGDDGSRLVSPFGLYDTLLKIPCSFGVAEDGQTRCLPAVVLVYPDLYADAGCTVPVAYFSKCTNPPPTYAYANTPGNVCGGGLRIHTLGATPTMLYRSIGTMKTCTATTAEQAGLSGVELRTMGPAVPPSTFIAGKMTESLL